MVYVLALAAALSNALTSVFQRMGVEDAPQESTMTLSLMTHAIRRGIWLLGFFFMVCSSHRGRPQRRFLCWRGSPARSFYPSGFKSSSSCFGRYLEDSI